MIGGDKYVRIGDGGWIAVDVLEMLFEVVVCIADGCLGSRAVDTRCQRIQAVTLIVLRAIRITRPEHQGKRVTRDRKTRQYRLRYNVYKILQWSDVCGCCSWRSVI